MKKLIAAVVLLLVLALLFAGGVFHCWKMRDTDAARRQARKDVARELRACPSEGVLPYLWNLTTNLSLHVSFLAEKEADSSPWAFWTLRLANLPRVSYDYIGQLTEDQFIRFAGDGAGRAADAPRLKDLLAFSDDLLKRAVLSASAAASLRERRLDGFFLVGDYAGAIALLEGGGIANRSPAWCKGTAAKLRAHQALDGGDKKEAIRQFLAFGEFMLSDEQKDFEDCDPTTGLLYSRDWVVARNFLRCANLSKETGDAAAANKYRNLAKTHFATAREKAKDDRKSLEALEAEMKSAGL